MYGVNTGIGEFSEVVLTDEQVEQFQKYLIYNHAAGIGDPAPVDHVSRGDAPESKRSRHGVFGRRPEIASLSSSLLNKGVTPVVCTKGSVGACGDLAPMSQIALLMMGEGEAFFGENDSRGERLSRRPESPSRVSKRATGLRLSTART